MKHGSLFSGIGGFDLAAQWMVWENVFQVEKDGFCQKVLAKNFPETKRYGDIKEFDGQPYNGLVDIISGGFPCQPFSIAGNRKGNEDERALWPEMLRIIRQIEPTYIVAENVPGLLTIDGGMVFEQVCLDLENSGYEVQPFIIPAASKNAPHKRERIWIVAHRNGTSTKYPVQTRGNIVASEIINNATHPDIGTRRPRDFTKPIKEKFFELSNDNSVERIDTDTQKTKCKQPGTTRTRRNGFANGNIHVTNTNHYAPARQRRNGGEILREPKPKRLDGLLWQEPWNEVATEFCRVDARVSDRVDRLKSLGNAIVPQVAYEIFKAIQAIK